MYPNDILQDSPRNKISNDKRKTNHRKWIQNPLKIDPGSPPKRSSKKQAPDNIKKSHKISEIASQRGVPRCPSNVVFGHVGASGAPGGQHGSQTSPRSPSDPSEPSFLMIFGPLLDQFLYICLWFFGSGLRIQPTPQPTTHNPQPTTPL